MPAVEGSVSFFSVKEVSDIGQKDVSWPIVFKMPFKKIVGIIGRFKSLGHPSIGIGLSYGTEKTIFLHEPDDLLSVHLDANMQ